LTDSFLIQEIDPLTCEGLILLIGCQAVLSQAW